MSRSYQTELTTACMVFDRATGNVVVQERTRGDWTGLCFPGGHVEDGESYTECVIREVREETGLEIVNPRQEGIVHWEDRDTHLRTVIVFFRADEFSGELKPMCDEAKNRWTPLKTLRGQPLADWFAEQLAIYEDPSLQEMYYAYGRAGADKPLFYRAADAGALADRDDGLLSRVRRATLAMQRHDWEQGVVAQAFLESGDDETASLLAVEGANRQTEDGRCCQLNAGSAATDPCAIGEALMAACGRTNDPALCRARDRLIDWALTGAPRNAEGVVYHFAGRQEFWVDSFYMLPPFLARAGFFDEAMKQIDGWWRALYREDNGLLAHRWDDGAQRFIRRDAWGVGNGWALAGMTRVALMPGIRADEAARLVSRIEAILTAARACQRADGLFHDVLDDPSSFVEVNFAQMFAYTIYRAVAAGWLASTWLDGAEKARAAALRAVDRFGLVRGVCGAPHFDRPGVAPEGQAFFILMEAARAAYFSEAR